jgi:hypothetical protein
MNMCHKQCLQIAVCARPTILLLITCILCFVVLQAAVPRDDLDVDIAADAKVVDAK